MSTVISERRTYVAGRWIEGDEALAVENPADESHFTDVSVTRKRTRCRSTSSYAAGWR